MREEINRLENIIKNSSKYRAKMEVGEKYYNQENIEIMSRKKQMGIQTKNGGYTTVEDPYRANHKLASGFARQQIMQKVNYLINNNMTFTDQTELTETLFPDYRKYIKKLAMRVSYQIWGAWQFYIDDNNLLQKKLIYGDELIPIFADDDKDEVVEVIRYYKKNNKYIAEWYDSEIVKTFEKEKTKWKLVKEEPHITNQQIVGEQVVNERELSWGRPPFAFLFNNDEMRTDVEPIKNYIDVYDITNSDFANNIDDFQEIYRTLKNFQGQDLAEFNMMLKKLKAVPIGEDGEVQTHQAEVPVNARKEYLRIIREDIFESGMAVDLKNIAAGNVTNVAIAGMFEALNWKCNAFEQELQDFWGQVRYFTNRYFEIVGSNERLINELVFDRKLLINTRDEVEQQKIEVETAGLLMGMLDKETFTEVVAKLDFLKDKTDITAEELLGRLEKEESAFNIEEEPMSEGE